MILEKLSSKDQSIHVPFSPLSFAICIITHLVLTKIYFSLHFGPYKNN